MAGRICDDAVYESTAGLFARVIAHTERGVAFRWLTGPRHGRVADWDREEFARTFRRRFERRAMRRAAERAA